MPGKGRRLRWISRLLAGACMAGLGAGCATSGANHNSAPTAHDPLLGGPPIQPQASLPPNPRTTQPGVPPLPVNTSSSSTAALASGNSKTFDPQNDLRIGSNRGVMPAAAWQGQGTPQSVVLSPPEMGNDPQLGRDSGPGSARAVLVTSTPRARTLEQAYAQLAARGVKQLDLKSVGENGQCHFICWVPNAQNPDVSRTHEATAANQLAALQAVIDKIDQERQSSH